jgi:hypothetical protein
LYAGRETLVTVCPQNVRTQRARVEIRGPY